MGLVDLANEKNARRGYECYKEGNVKSCQKEPDERYRGLVSEGRGKSYRVLIDLIDPLKSRCGCPRTGGRGPICRHMVALYFAAFPDAAADYYREVVWTENEAERRRERSDAAVVLTVSKMTEDELRETLLKLLFEGPKRQLDRFKKEHPGDWPD